jgi:gamma-glutamyltranspeptidase / glutathione hydrolase
LDITVKHYISSSNWPVRCKYAGAHKARLSNNLSFLRNIFFRTAMNITQPFMKIAGLTTTRCLRICAYGLTALLAACAAPTGTAPSSPESATGFDPKQGVFAKQYMAATANPHATRAAYDMLKRGGSAVDAAIAAQMVLTLTEPQSSGIGGGALLLHFDGKTVVGLDGRETAPAAADEKLFLDAQGQPIKFYDAVVGGRAVGTPGAVAMLQEAHARWGVLPWEVLFVPAVTLATEGFEISPRLHALLTREEHLKKDPVAAAYFYNADGTAKALGTRLKNPELAATLQRIALEGKRGLLEGPVAQAIVAKVQGHATNPGKLAVSDLANYQVKERAPICRPYRTVQVCGFAPPSSGGIAIAQMLAMLTPRNIALAKPENGTPNTDAVHLMSELGRLAFADRNQYVADTDFVPLPGADFGGLLDSTYLQQRSANIGAESKGRARPGTPPGMRVSTAPQAVDFEAGTSHISIVDAQGRAVSMTTTIEDVFGARQMVGGFLLNNQLTDFSFAAAENGVPIANRVQASKRPRSSMAPTLVLDGKGQRVEAVVGSPGGSLIINYVFKTLVGMLDWNLAPQAAIDLPNFGSRNGPTEVEKDRMPDAVGQALTQRQHEVRAIEMPSGLQAIKRVPGGWLGGADPRREGVVRGD